MTTHEPFIETYLGERFQPLAPQQSTIFIEDIAHALSNQCRFSGHTTEFYSVAEHSIRVMTLLADWGEDEDVQLWGLMHDASEAYLVDLPTPLKAHPTIGAGYSTAEKALMRAICARFSLPERMPEAVKVADAVMLATEARDLMPHKPEHWRGLVVKPDENVVVPYGPTTSKQIFLAEFRRLDGLR